MTLKTTMYRLSVYPRKLITPGLKNSQERYRELLQKIITPGSDWIDIGCGHQIFPEWLRDSLASERELVARCHTAVGVDCGDERPHRSLQSKYTAPAEKLPFPDAAFSVATANMVVEHLTAPEASLREIFRVLRPGGLFAFHTPNARTPLVRLARIVPASTKSRIVSMIDGRDEDDIFPTHYRLNNAKIIREFAAKSGFLVASLAFVESSPILVMLGPVVLFELFAISILRHEQFAHLRPDMLVVLRKPTESGGVVD